MCLGCSRHTQVRTQRKATRRQTFTYNSLHPPPSYIAPTRMHEHTHTHTHTHAHACINQASLDPVRTHARTRIYRHTPRIYRTQTHACSHHRGLSYILCPQTFTKSFRFGLWYVLVWHLGQACSTDDMALAQSAYSSQSQSGLMTWQLMAAILLIKTP